MQTEHRDDELIVNYADKPFSGTGIVSQVMWDNPNMKAALRVIFNCKDNERILAIVVNDLGVKAYFEWTEEAT